MSTPVPAGALGDLTVSPARAGVVAQVAEPSPDPSGPPAGGFEPWEVSPGLLGFVPVFLIALACVGLFLSLTREMRKVTVRQALRDAEEAAARPDPPAADDGPTPGAPPDGDRPGDGPAGSR